MKKDKKIIFIFAILIIIFSISIVPKNFQNDTFFTIAVGEKILKEGIYTQETFTWHEGLEYENVRWVFDIVIATIYNIFDFFGIYIFVMIMTALIGVTLFYILLYKKNNPLLSFIIVIATMYLGSSMFCARAQIVSFWLFLLELYFIEKLLETGKKKYSIILFFIGVFVANIHASVFPMFFLIFVPYIAEYMSSKMHFIKNGESKIIIREIPNINALLRTLFFCLFSGLITPIGVIPYTDMLKTVGAISSDIIAEMQPLLPINTLGFMCIIIIVLGIIGFTKTKVRLADVLFLLGFSLLSLSTIRSIYFFYFIGSISLATIINDFLKEYKINEFEFNIKVKRIMLIIIVSIFIIISLYNFSEKLTLGYCKDEWCPTNAADYILENIDINNMKLYNGFNIGSYLEFRGIPVFMDSRAEIYIEQFNDTTILEDFIKITNGNVHYKTILDQYEITHALLYNSEIINVYISEDSDWKCIYQDDTFSLYERVK